MDDYWTSSGATPALFNIPRKRRGCISCKSQREKEEEHPDPGEELTATNEESYDQVAGENQRRVCW